MSELKNILTHRVVFAASCGALSVAILLLASVQADADPPAANATTQPSPNPQANSNSQPSSQATQAPVVAPTAPPAQSFGLLGDFGGARTRLAKRGITFNGHVTSEFAGNVTGGIPLGGTAVDRGTALSTEVGAGFDADLGMLTGTGAGVIHALVTTRFGSNLSSTALGNHVSVQEIYGDGQTTRFTYLDYEQPLFQKKLSLLLGKINQQNDFIAGSTYWGGNLYCFYQNNNLCGTPGAIPTNNGVTSAGTAGFNYYPSSMWGVRLKASPSKSFYIEAAALQANPIVNTSHGGTYFGLAGAIGTELPVEVGVTLRNPSGESVGVIRVGGYYDPSNVLSYANRIGPVFVPASPSLPAVQVTLPSQYVRGRSGAYVQLDHLIAGRSAAGQSGTAVFVAAEYSDPNTALLSSFVDAGLVRSGTLRSRPNDTIALGFATNNYNPRLQHLQLALQAAGLRFRTTAPRKPSSSIMAGMPRIGSSFDPEFSTS